MNKMFLIYDIIVLFVIFGNSVHDCSEIIGNYTNQTINDKSCGYSLFSSEPQLCFKYHNNNPWNLRGARNALQGEAPWSMLVVIEYYSGNSTDILIKRSCGGVLVDKEWVMTSAHCLFDPNTGKRFTVPVSVYPSHVSAQDKYIAFWHRLYTHQKFSINQTKPGSSYDIGLIKLNTSVSINPGVVNTICLPPERNSPNFGEEFAMSTGWNDINNEQGIKSNRLQIVSLKVSLNSMIRSKGKEFPHEIINRKGWPGYIYGKSLGKQKICGSDSGSPVWQYYLGRAVLIGIVSNAHLNLTSDDCQYEDITGYYPNGTKVLKEAQSYITWVPMMMDWVKNRIKGYKRGLTFAQGLMYWTQIILLPMKFKKIVESCLKDQSFDLLILSIQWAPGFCKVIKCNNRYQNEWTLHGLWPLYYNGSYPKDCCFEREFNYTKIKSLWKELTKNWYTLKLDKNDKYFWRYEWEKHGTCAMESEKLKGHFNYFNQTLYIFTKYPIQLWLNDSGIYPSNTKSYNLSAIHHSIESRIGNKRVELDCNILNGSPILKHIYICLDKITLEPINCTMPDEDECGTTTLLLPAKV